MGEYETILLQQNEANKGIFILELNRPESLNAMNTQMGKELIQSLTELAYNKEIRVLIVTGSGDRGFCVGADLKERNGMSKDEWKKQHEIFERASEVLREFPYPVIAGLNGYALGGGLELALGCDMRIAANHAKLGLPEAKVGLIPGIGGTQLLPRTIPVGLAKEMLYRGSHISAERALHLGLVNAVCDKEELLDTALEIASDIAKNAPLSLKAIKQAVNQGLQTDIHTALTIELSHYYTCANSEDRLEGIRAFNEKREPNWQGK